jgi:thymidine phosphorylase
MSKKLAEGSNALVLDVKCGRGAFMQRPSDARALARAMVSIGAAAGLRTEAFITRMDTPLGRAVGNAVEIAECIELLSGRGPDDLAHEIATIAARMIVLAGKAATEAEATTRVEQAIASGAAREKLKQMITWQGGDPSVVDDPGRLPQARHVHHIKAAKAGCLQSLDALLVGRTAVALGAGRDKKSDPVDLSAGIIIHKKPGDPVASGEPILELRYNDESRLKTALGLAQQAAVIGDRAPAETAQMIGWVHDAGEQMFVALP